MPIPSSVNSSTGRLYAILDKMPAAGVEKITQNVRRFGDKN
jgi:hypothetical protein